MADERRTVLFSSHLLDEIERVSDRIAMMANGRMILSGPLDKILETHHRLTLRFERAPQTPPQFKGALGVSGDGLEWTVLCNGDRLDVVTAAKEMGASVVGEQGATLDEIFIARVGLRAGEENVLGDK